MTGSVRSPRPRGSVDGEPVTGRVAGATAPDDGATSETGSGRRPWRRPLGTVLVALAVVAVFATAALGYSLTRPKVYGAEAEFVLTPRPELSDAAVDRVMLTQVMIVRSPAVLRPVAARGGASPRELRDAVTAEIVGRSNILRIRVGDRRAERAVTLVELIAVQYAQVATAGRTGETAPVQATVLTPARPLENRLAPQPVRALAAGTLLGLLAAVVVVLVVRRPRGSARATPPSRG